MKEHYEVLRYEAAQQLHHEDRLFSDRIRNFLMATAFLIGGYGMGKEDVWVRCGILLLGPILSVYYLRIGVRCAEAIRFWRVLHLYAEEKLEGFGNLRESLPDRFARKPKYEEFLGERFWRFFGDTNTVQGLWVPAACLWFWLTLLLGFIVSVPRLGLDWVLLLVAGWVLVLLGSISWVWGFQRNLRQRFQPKDAEGWFIKRN